MATAEKVMQFRLKAEEKDRIRHSASLRGVSASQFVLHAALKEAEHAVAEQKTFFLTENRFRSFMSALDADPAPNPALGKLLNSAAPWD